MKNYFKSQNFRHFFKLGTFYNAQRKTSPSMEKKWNIFMTALILLLIPFLSKGQLTPTAGSQTLVNTYTTDNQQDPTIAMDDNGNFVVAWRSYGQDGSNDGIFAQRYDNAGATVGAEFQVNTYSSEEQYQPAVAMDNDGDFIVVWSSNTNGGVGLNDWGIFGQLYDNTGSTVGSEFQINTYTSSTQYNPSVTMDGTGNFAVVWESYGQDGDDWGVYMQRYDNTGATIGIETKVNSYTNSNQFEPFVAMDDDGDFVVTWTSDGQDGSNYGVYMQRYDNAGATVGSETLVNTYTSGHQWDPTAAMDSNGDFVITWESQSQDGDNYGIYAQRYNNAGTAQGSEFLVNTYTTEIQLDQEIAMNDDGDFIITWISNGQDGFAEGIYAQQYNSAGTAQGSEFLVNTYTTGTQWMPTIAMDNNENFVIAWAREGTEDAQGIYLQRYANPVFTEKSAVGSNFLVNTYTTGNQFYPSTAMDDNGNFVVAWTSWAQDGDNAGIYAQRYDNTGTTVGSEFIVNTYTTSAQSYSSVAMDDDGDFVITWSSYDQDGDGWGIYGQRYDNTGTATGTEFKISTNSTNLQYYPSVAMDDDGDFVVVWMDAAQDGSGNGIYGQRYSNTGATVGSEFLINTSTSGNQTYPTTAIDSDGDFVVTWVDELQEVDGYGVYMQMYDNTGTTVGSETLVNTYTTSDQHAPSIAMDSDGGFIIVWRSDGQDGDDGGIYAQRYSNSGTIDGSEFKVNTYTTDNQSYPVVTMDDNGNFAITWVSEGQDGSSDGIYAQQYDNTGTVQGSEFIVNTYTTNDQKEPAIAMDSDGNFVIVWDGSGGIPDNNGIYAQLYGDAVPLPVELIDFYGTIYHGETVMLQWYTASEIDNKGFELQRSNDHKNWKTLDFIEGKGTTVESQSYEYLDQRPIEGINYYRLKQIDFDGQFEYSKVVIAEFEAKHKYVKIFPNPINDRLNISNIKDIERAVIYNGSGQIVLQVLISDASISIDVKDLSQGIYTLQLIKNDGVSFSKSIIKQ